MNMIATWAIQNCFIRGRLYTSRDSTVEYKTCVRILPPVD